MRAPQVLFVYPHFSDESFTPQHLMDIMDPPRLHRRKHGIDKCIRRKFDKFVSRVAIYACIILLTWTNGQS